MGLYISAHPLDNYDAYFEEQTIPLSQLSPDIDGKKVTIGGLISKIRTIITKSGSKMAFVGIEDKTGETELVIFPNLFEQYGAKLVQDAVIKATGKINARDRDGNIGTDAKMIVDDIQFVTDEELNNYESTGRKMNKPKVSSKVEVKRVSKAKPAEKSEIIEQKDDNRKLYIHIKDPDDHESLLSLKQICSNFIGSNNVVLVLGSDKKSAVKLPFKVELSDNLTDSLIKVLGKESVVVK